MTNEALKRTMTVRTDQQDIGGENVGNEKGIEIVIGYHERREGQVQCPRVVDSSSDRCYGWSEHAATVQVNVHHILNLPNSF